MWRWIIQKVCHYVVSSLVCDFASNSFVLCCITWCWFSWSVIYVAVANAYSRCMLGPNYVMLGTCGKRNRQYDRVLVRGNNVEHRLQQRRQHCHSASQLRSSRLFEMSLSSTQQRHELLVANGIQLRHEHVRSIYLLTHILMSWPQKPPFSPCSSFFNVIAIHAIVSLGSVYNYIDANSWSLKRL